MRRFVLILVAAYKKLMLFSMGLRGLTPESRAHRRIATGRSWEEFCDTLKAAGATIMKHGDLDPRTQAEGYRYLSRLTRAGLEAFIEHADPKAPVLRRMVHETVKMGADNPDNHYQNAVVSGDYEYRISGKRGTVNFLGFSTQKGGYGKGGNLPPTGFLDSGQFEVGPDGRLEIIVSTAKKDGNWLPMEKETGLLIVRQTFLDKNNEEEAQLTIERIGDNRRPSEVSPASVDDGLMNAANLVAGASFLFSKWTHEFKKHANSLPLFDPEKSTAMGGDPKIAYYHSFWRLEEDEALVVEVKPPRCEHWNFQLNNYWMESLDYRYFKIHINKHTATYNDDGRVRVIVAHRDPDLPNWLTTTGHTMGTMCWRWIRADEHPKPDVTLVPFEELGRYR